MSITPQSSTRHSPSAHVSRFPPIQPSAQGGGHSCPTMTGAGTHTWVWGPGSVCGFLRPGYTPASRWEFELFCATWLLRFIVLLWASRGFCRGY